MVLFRASDTETPLPSPPSFTCSEESATVPPVPPATSLNPSVVNNLSLSSLNYVSGNPATPPCSDPISLSRNTPFQSPPPESFSNPANVLGPNQSVVPTHTQTFSNPRQSPMSSDDLEHNLSQLILSEGTHDVQGNTMSEVFAHAPQCFSFSARPSLNAGYNSYGANGVSFTGKSDQPVIISDDSDDENTMALASLLMEKPTVGSSIVNEEQNARKSLVVENPTAETALMSEKTAEASVLSEEPAHGTTNSPPATKSLMGSGSGSSKSFKNQRDSRDTPLKLKLVLPVTRNDKSVDVVQANNADVADAADVANVGIGIEVPERKTWNLRPRGALDKSKDGHVHGSSEQKSRIQTRSRTGKQVQAATPPKFSFTLTKEEIEADFLAMTGSMPPKKPKKRAKNLQRQLDRQFPGLCLGSVSAEAYDHADQPLKG